MQQGRNIRSAITYSFLENVYHNKWVEYISSEYFYIFYLFYSQQIESGQSKIKDFHNMCMNDVNQELKLRAILLRKNKEVVLEKLKQREVRRKEQEKQDQIDLFERLKRETMFNP